MTLVEWDETLTLGVQRIDADHEKLVEILNRCYSALMQHDHTHELHDIVVELLDYTQYHFGTEEALMRAARYPAAKAHTAAHRTFIKSIHNFRDRFEAGESFVAIDVLVFLKDWLVAHIQNTDRSLAQYVTEVAGL
ncbi:bacteriohemerythrin [Geomonas ferrireducens]|uniref:bacteriohemerythrin n=1 Tax=Geomonas ferrireducens TaxID=2570227 RepID=UPI0010A7AE8E|nr:bacteriohemerythrin [Geomonas ferrireducens]